MALTTHSATSRDVISSTNPATSCIDITPSNTNFLADSNDKARVTRAISVDVAGTIKVTFVDNIGVPVTRTVVAGVMYPWAVVQVFATGTTATGVAGYF